ncbi:MAG: outer membrane beta-barrel protein [Pseudomonadota bacterium]
MAHSIRAFLAGLCVAAVGMTVPANAGSVEVGAYLGVNDSFRSDVTLTQGAARVRYDNLDFDGKTWTDAPYWGARATYWLDDGRRWGVGVDLTHATAVSDASVTGADWRRLEFSDGLNTVLLTGFRQFRDSDDRLYPYVGVGVGLAVPWVEAISAAGSTSPVQSDTFELQLTGVAAQILGGGKWEFSNRGALFLEYKLGYAMIKGDLTEGGSIETDILNNQFLAGISYRFGK